MTHYFHNPDDIEWRELTVDQIVPMRCTSPLWRVATADHSVYHCNLGGVIATLEKAKIARKIVKAGIFRDMENKEWILSIVRTDEQAKETGAGSDKIDPRPLNALF